MISFYLKRLICKKPIFLTLFFIRTAKIEARLSLLFALGPRNFSYPVIILTFLSLIIKISVMKKNVSDNVPLAHWNWLSSGWERNNWLPLLFEIEDEEHCVCCFGSREYPTIDLGQN